MPLLYRLVPESSSLKKGWVAMKLLGGDLDYNVWKMFNKLGCDTIYEVGGHIRLKSDQNPSCQDRTVCSGRSHGIRGLGTEVTRRSAPTIMP